MVEVGLVVFVMVVLGLTVRRVYAESDTYYDSSEGEQYGHKWGYTDTRFEFDGPDRVRVTGNRYQICGYSMPYFLPFVEEMLGVTIREEDLGVENKDIAVSAPHLNASFMEAVKSRFEEDRYSVDDKERLVHSHGQLSVDEIYRVLYGDSLPRVVDLVFYPQEEADVQGIIELAHEHDVCLIPYGGGTNVSGALAIPTEEQRMVVSVNMRGMDRIVLLDQENFLAVVEAGISGKQLENALREQGYTSGHDPDSIEFSTLGGWISTNASGMKKNKYGNIEDIVLEATLVTPTGKLETKQVTPRNSTGVQPRGFLFGSEGNFGIITKATIKIHRKPEVQKYGSLVFPTFEHGVDFLKALRQTNILPASIRLVNNIEFRFGQALKPAASGMKALLQKVQKFFLLHVKGFDPEQMVASTIVMEGSRAEVRFQKKTIFGLARKFGGISGGATNGKRGYMLTFGIAYIRDFFNQFRILGETFETSVSWDRILIVCKSVEQELAKQCEQAQVAGKPYLSYRVTQTYHTGVCIYFTMGFAGKGLDKPDEVFHAIEQRLRQVILDHGGSLSHHHGIGKIRQHFLPQIQSEKSMDVLRQSKVAMDPKNVFGVRNGVFYDT
ncbi:MAG: FAD-binding oxidoreductase [bacterium]|nr:FAD-binding oxidoreductase [bacterium]